MLVVSMSLVAAATFLSLFELREVTEPARVEGEQAQNPLYFARRLLVEMGFDARVAPAGVARDLDLNAVLVLDTERQRLRDEHLDHLLAWVARGGHLVLRAVTPERNRDAPPPTDPLLERLGLEVSFSPDLAYPDAANPHLFRSRSGRTDELDVFFVGYYTLAGHRAGDEILADANGVHLVHRALGEGAITVLSDLDFLHNDALCTHAHAAALWHLVNRVHEPPARVWLAHTEAYPALPLLLWQHAWAALAALMLLAAAGAWHAGARFGPLRPPPDHVRRELRQHLEASAYVYWRQGDHARLLRALQWAVDRRARRHLRVNHDATPLADRAETMTPQAFTAHVRQLNRQRTGS